MATKSKGVNRAPVTAEVFVRTWLESDSGSDVARRLGMSKQSVSDRASSLREKGVRLPEFGQRGRPTVNVEALNTLIDSSEGAA